MATGCKATAIWDSSKVFLHVSPSLCLQHAHVLTEFAMVKVLHFVFPSVYVWSLWESKSFCRQLLVEAKRIGVRVAQDFSTSNKRWQIYQVLIKFKAHPLPKKVQILNVTFSQFKCTLTCLVHARISLVVSMADIAYTLTSTTHKVDPTDSTV